ncbi:MAG TPA: transcriptional repressor [Kiritimatiellae bacterium]|nr:transcriptional repressor [Kiritimatiellia bacterium]
MIRPRQKANVYHAVENLASHPTADEVFAHMRGTSHRISLATVYRNLEALVAEGKLLRLPTIPRRYDHRTQSHTHVICRVCGRVEDLFSLGDCLKGLEREAAGKGFVEVKAIAQAWGLCAHCARNQGI